MGRTENKEIKQTNTKYIHTKYGGNEREEEENKEKNAKRSLELLMSFLSLDN